VPLAVQAVITAIIIIRYKRETEKHKTHFAIRLQYGIVTFAGSFNKLAMLWKFTPAVGRRVLMQGFLLVNVIHAGAQNNDTTSMEKTVHKLDEVVVSSHSAKERMDNVQIGQEKVKIADLVKVPSLLGERDIIKSLQLLPGIKAESEASSGFQVRGGTASQNLVLLDNATVYQAGHLMGMFSSFNDDALTNATLSKGMIPAQYGDATSSVLDVQTKAGDMQRYRYGATVGLLSAKGYVEGPIAKDKASFLFTARRSYADMFLVFTKDYKDCSLYFYDMNGKADWQIDRRNRLSLNFFHGKDVMGITDFCAVDWKNTSLTLRWLHYFGERLSSVTNMYLSNYDSYMEMEGIGIYFDEAGYIRHYGLNHNFKWMPADKLSFDIGLQSVVIDLLSAEWSIGSVTQRERRKAWENALWVNGIWSPSAKLSMSAGVRLNMFSALGGSPYYDIDKDGEITRVMNPSAGDFVKTYTTVEPRMSINYKLTESQSIKAGYSLTSQNIHAIRSSSWSWPFDRYTMSSNIVKPEMAWQASAGYAAMLCQGAYDFSVEGYYKDVDNVYDYRDGKSFRSEIEMERLLLGGKSRSYGAEVGIHKNKGRLTGWISYTLSWVENKIEGIDNNRWYTASNDRRHDISVVAMYQLSEKWDLSASWKFNTGQALTAPSAKYMVDGDYYYYYNERNGYRAPSYHRLDVGANYTRKKRKYTDTWSFGIYNLYNRRNPFMIGFENDHRAVSGVQAFRISLFGIIPSVAYTVKF